jgi:tetratricopeptide (TPR) repeat protein
LSELYAVRAALRDEQGRTQEALTDLKHAVTLNPNDSWAFAELARLHSVEGEPHTALRDLRQALVLNPLDFVLHARHCLVLQDLAMFARATAACDRARALQGPGGNWATVVSEWLARSQGNLKQAMVWSGQALRADPQSIGAYERRAEIMLTLGMAAEARELYRQARIATHDEEAVEIGLAKAAYCQNGADGLRQYLESTGLDRSAHARTLIDTAYLRLLLGEPRQADDLVQRAMRASDFDPVRFNGAWFARWGWSDELIRAAAEVGTGDRPDAMKDLQQIADLIDRLVSEGEQRGGLYALKAEVLALRGSDDSAMRALSQAVELGWRESWWAQREPYLASLRSRTDFRNLMERVDDLNRRTRDELKPDE